MKILRISLRNIASLAGEHTVDFTKAPLVNAGLFSISGPTGSGKSTLLDALCLALYDETPRMKNVEGASAIHDAGAEIQQRDVRNLLRRGCGEGFAEVAFKGVDGHTYTACWEVRRAQGKADRKLQKTQHSLWKGNVPYGSARVAAADGTATEVRKEIAAKVGLSFDQFRRAVLLAQGDFATFLKARDTERAEILQALTGTERFEKISVAVFNRHKQEEGLVQDLRNQMGGVLPMAPEAREEADEALRMAVAFQANIAREYTARQKQIEWFDLEIQQRKKNEEASAEVLRLEALVKANSTRVQELHWVRITQLEAAPKRAAEKQSQAALADAQQNVASVEQSAWALSSAIEKAALRHKHASETLQQVTDRRQQIDADLVRARELDGQLNQLQAVFSLADKEYATAVKAFKKMEGEVSILHEKLTRLSEGKQRAQERISRVADFGPFASDREVWLERLKALETLHAKKGLCSKRRREAEDAVHQAAGLLEKASAQLLPLQSNRDVAAAEWNRASQKTAAFHTEDILTRRRNATELLTALQKLRHHLQEKSRLQSEYQGIKDSIDALKQEKAADEILREEYSAKRIPDALSVLNQARKSLALVEAAASEHAAVLRGALVQGQACPVCGSLEHPGAEREGSAEAVMLEALRRDAAAKEDALLATRADFAALGVAIEDKIQRSKKLSQDANTLEQRLAEAGGYVPVLEEVALLYKKPESQRVAALDRAENETRDLLALLDTKDAERIEAEKLQTKLRAEMDAAERTFQSAEKAEVQFRNAYAAALSDQKKLEADVSALESELASALEVVSPLESVFLQNGNTSESASMSVGETAFKPWTQEFRQWFERGSFEYKTVLKILEEAVQQEAIERGHFDTLTSSLATAREATVMRGAARDSAARTLADQKAERSGLLSGRTVEVVEGELAAEWQAANTCLHESSAVLAGEKTKGDLNRIYLEEQRQRVIALTDALNEARNSMDQWMVRFSAREACQIDRVQMDEWLGRDVDWIQREQRELDAAAIELQTARGKELAMRQQWEAHVRTKTWEDDYGTVEAELQRLAAESAAASSAADGKRAAVLNDDARRRKTGELAAALEAQEKRADPWRKLNLLIGSADGARFRNIAQQWTLEILLRHANAQLALLSGRYRLERLRDSLNLLVTDLEMDGQQRSVHSLSGGESFLVSLGLALGLASLTSSRLLIESLFIDEGFGSLDSETLRVALNALSHLESQGRKVGVISHVSEMVDAIPVQVRVVRSTGGSSKILV